MQDKFNLDQSSLKKGLNEIEKLNPKPEGSISSFQKIIILSLTFS